MWGVLSDERMGLLFTILAGPCQRSHSPVRVTRDASQIRDSPNLEGQVPIFISPRDRVAQLYPQGYGGGIRTRLLSGSNDKDRIPSK
jgi:hypothetical protein